MTGFTATSARGPFLKLSTSPLARAKLWPGVGVTSSTWNEAPGCQGPDAAKPNSRTLEPSASAIARPPHETSVMSHSIVYAILVPSGDQCGESAPAITCVKSDPSGAKV